MVKASSRLMGHASSKEAALAHLDEDEREHHELRVSTHEMERTKSQQEAMEAWLDEDIQKNVKPEFQAEKASGHLLHGKERIVRPPTEKKVKRHGLLYGRAKRRKEEQGVDYLRK